MSPDKYKEWIDYADSDLRYAKLGFTDEYPAYHTICFLCQASVEKFLKALCIKFEITLKRTHDLIFISNQLRALLPKILEVQEFIEILNPYSVETRYPGDLDFSFFNNDLAVEAVNSAEKVQYFVNNIIPIG